MSGTEVEEQEIGRSVLAQLVDTEGHVLGNTALALPSDTTPEQLSLLLQELIKEDEPVPYRFRVGDIELETTLAQDVLQPLKKSTEETIQITYLPQAVFRVKTVSRCASAMQGHEQAVLTCQYNATGTCLATGSGDKTVRLWDLNTNTTKQTLEGHTSHVMCLAWSPDTEWLVSGDLVGDVILWHAPQSMARKRKRATKTDSKEETEAPSKPTTGLVTENDEQGTSWKLRGHKKAVTGVAWEPFHSYSFSLSVCKVQSVDTVDTRAKNGVSRFATASKDATVRIWDPVKRTVQFTFGSHTDAVMAVKWGGNDLLYTGGRDRSIKVWSTEKGILVRSLEGHAHWVNAITLSTDFVLRTGCYDHRGSFGVAGMTTKQKQERALERYQQATKGKSEKLVSGSDDFTMFLWDPEVAKKPIARMTGHQQLIPHVAFSPDGTMIASCSFDKSIKIWNGTTGQFMFHLRGHVGAVYQIAWSSDSRLLVSASKDSTIKSWEMRTKKMNIELPGHADEVFAIDWSPGGDSVATGGKDKLVRMYHIYHFKPALHDD